MKITDHAEIRYILKRHGERVKHRDIVFEVNAKFRKHVEAACMDEILAVIEKYKSLREFVGQ
jgi:hypothetical protein